MWRASLDLFGPRACLVSLTPAVIRSGKGGREEGREEGREGRSEGGRE